MGGRLLILTLFKRIIDIVLYEVEIIDATRRTHLYKTDPDFGRRWRAMMQARRFFHTVQVRHDSSQLTPSFRIIINELADCTPGMHKIAGLSYSIIRLSLNEDYSPNRFCPRETLTLQDDGQSDTAAWKLDGTNSLQISWIFSCMLTQKWLSAR